MDDSPQISKAHQTKFNKNRNFEGWPTASRLQGKVPRRRVTPPETRVVPNARNTAACAKPAALDVWKGGARNALRRIIGTVAASAADHLFKGPDVAVYKIFPDKLNLDRVATTLKDPIRQRDPTGDNPLCIKLSFFNAASRHHRPKTWLAGALHEAQAHVDISRRVLAGQVCGQKTFVICPRLLLAGLHVGPYPDVGCVFVSIMECAPGMSLNSDTGFMTRLKNRGIDASVYAQLEKTVVGMWMKGYAQGDMHYGNVIKSGTSFQIIDFGLAVPLSHSKTVEFTRAFADLLETRPGGSVTRLWYDFFKNNVENVQLAREYEYFHSDGRFLAYMRRSVRDPENIGKERRKLWECAAAPPPRRTSSPPKRTSSPPKRAASPRRTSSPPKRTSSPPKRATSPPKRATSSASVPTARPRRRGAPPPPASAASADVVNLTGNGNNNVINLT